MYFKHTVLLGEFLHILNYIIVTIVNILCKTLQDLNQSTLNETVIVNQPQLHHVQQLRSEHNLADISRNTEAFIMTETDTQIKQKLRSLIIQSILISRFYISNSDT